MFSLYRTLSLRYLSRRWFRAMLIVASIMLGVATLIATQSLAETMSKATLASGNPMAGTLDLIVTNGELPVDRSLVNEIAKVPGIRSVQPRIFGQAKVVINDKRLSVLVLGIVLRSDDKNPDELEDLFELDAGTKKLLDAMAKPNQEGSGPGGDTRKLKDYFDTEIFGTFPAILGKELDQEVKNDPDAVNLALKLLNLDRTLKFFTVEKSLNKFQLVRVASVAPKEETALTALGGYVVVLGLENAGKVLGYEEAKVRRIDIALKPNVDPNKARAAIEKVLANRADVRTMAEQNKALQSATVGMKTAFSMCGVAALIVGMFLVYNALSVSVAERRHEIGILLSLGATRDQVWRLFAGEAVVLGTIGAGLGIPLGAGLAYLGLQPMQDAVGDLFANMDLRQIELTWELVALGFGVGILSALIASLVPAVHAAQEKPAEAVRRMPKEPPVSHLVMHVVSVCLLILGGMGMILLRDLVPKRWGIFGGLVLVMIGALLAAPLIAQLAARALLPISRRFFPIEWRIAADNLIRAPGRTGMVIGALAAGVCLIVETAGIIDSNRVTIRDWVGVKFAADLVITSGSAVGSGVQNEPMKASLRDDLLQIDGVEEVLPVKLSYSIPYRDAYVAIATIIPERALELEGQRLASKDHLPMYQQMLREKNAVIISGNFAALHHVHPGEYIMLKSPKGEVKLRVIGTIVDYTWSVGTIIMDRQTYVDWWNDHSVTQFEVYLKKGVDPRDAKARISTKLGAQHDLFPLTRSELQVRIGEMIEKLYRIALGQEIVVVLVAALGVVTALLISVLQRRREMGLLRAIGASRAQVVYLVLAEASFMGVLGSVLGVLFAIPLEWYALKIIFLEEAGFDFDVFIPWTQGILVAVLAMVTATLAGLGPALYAVRQRIPDAIAYE